MKEKVYTIIGGLILVLGLLWYMQMHFSDYYEQRQLEAQVPIYSEANTEVYQLLNKGNQNEAIDRLIEMVKKDPDDLNIKLKLTQIYCNQCLLDTINCENAMWQLNSILKANPHQKDALDMKERVDHFLGDTITLSER